MATRDQRLSTLAFRLTPAVLSPHLKDMKHKELIARITYDPEIFGGKPIIRGHRLAVEHVLDMLAAGQNSATIPSGCPWMDSADIQACLTDATLLFQHERIELLPTALAS